MHATAPVVDLRSDTITRPTPQMREAMARAPVGDDVFGEDPSVAALERRTAEWLGKEAAVYVPSGTMSNQLGVKVHCAPGDEFLCEQNCHIYQYEQGGYAQLSGLAVRPVAGHFGVLELDQLKGLVRPDDDHHVRTRLVTLENTHNRGGGRILPLENIQTICRWAHEQGLATHLDGARLFNAVVATGIDAVRWAEGFDTVSVCFSKGLGAPVGSALAGPAPLIRRARRYRKLLGGGMRQAGIIAAGALFALEHHVERLADDHVHAKLLADAVRRIDGLRLEPPEVDTNIVIFAVDPACGTAADLTARLEGHGVRMLPMAASQVRAVTHLDISRADIERAADALERVVGRSG